MPGCLNWRGNKSRRKLPHTSRDVCAGVQFYHLNWIEQD